MASINKDLTVETRTGKIVTVDVTVEGTYDSHYRSDRDGNRGSGVWHIRSVSFQIPDCCNDFIALSQDEKNEVEKLIDEKVNEESWNFKRD